MPPSTGDHYQITGGGFPKHRATALVGVRGGMKSHLAYLWLLLGASGAKRNTLDFDQGSSLLVTLRDDEEEARARLTEIYKAERSRFVGLKEPASLEKDHILRIVHFRPGYIAPDEFLFRLWFHIRDFRPKRAVVSGLEQLDTLFPLCNVEPVFVPSIVDLFTESWGITSLFIGVSGEDQSNAQNGLLPTSALILRFSREPVQGKPAGSRLIIEVVRVPSAGPSGGKGELLLDNQNQLVFSPL
jgi:hypothetical protein